MRIILNLPESRWVSMCLHCRPIVPLMGSLGHSVHLGRSFLNLYMWLGCYAIVWSLKGESYIPKPRQGYEASCCSSTRDWKGRMNSTAFFFCRMCYMYITTTARCSLVSSIVFLVKKVGCLWLYIQSFLWPYSSEHMWYTTNSWVVVTRVFSRLLLMISIIEWALTRLLFCGLTL